jgi:diguanylate cyclase
MTKILLVEDDPGVRTVILKMLDAEGFDVISTTNGQRGIELARELEPDLIICDIMMPECNGYEVLHQLRQSSDTAAIPFIFLSAKSEKADLRQGMELGADDYLTKPFTRAELLGAIGARLTKRSHITQPYIDEMKKAAENLGQLAYRDPLTNLPNRILFHNRLQMAISQAKKQQKPLAVVCLDLDQFKSINTRLGHVVGDSLLQAVAMRISSTISEEDTVARMGADEFSIVLLSQPDEEAIAEFAQRLTKVVSAPYELNEHKVHAQVSVGITLYPKDGTTPDKLLNQADLAMRQVKEQGGSGYQFYSAEMDAIAAERQLLETSLSKALEQQELRLYYQPQVNSITGRIIGAEALVRWQHPELGLLYPGKFIPLAESTGLILPLGEWVLRTACQQAQAWQSANRLPIRVSVNLSFRQFKQQNLTETIAQILEETKLGPDVLVIELTETSVMENVDATINVLQELRQMGVQISIDDFGTGYSSLNYLKRFPIDTLKIDQSFVRDITTDTNDAAIAKAIIAMAQSMQLKVIAEGVETEEQFNFLRQIGCHAMQGHLFSMPITPEAFEQLLVEDKRLQVQQAS